MEGQNKMQEYWWFGKFTDTPGCICFKFQISKSGCTSSLTIFAHCKWRHPAKINITSNNIKAIMSKMIKQSMSFMKFRNKRECKQIWQQLKVVLLRSTTNKRWALSLILIIMELFFHSKSFLYYKHRQNTEGASVCRTQKQTGSSHINPSLNTF